MNSKITLVSNRHAGDYLYQGQLFLCKEFVKRVLSKYPDKIRVTASLKPLAGAKKIFIHPGYKQWGFNAKKPTVSRYAGMYSAAARVLYTKLGVSAIGDESPWFSFTDYVEQLKSPVAIYVKIVKA